MAGTEPFYRPRCAAGEPARQGWSGNFGFLSFTALSYALPRGSHVAIPLARFMIPAYPTVAYLGTNVNVRPVTKEVGGTGRLPVASSMDPSLPPSPLPVRLRDRHAIHVDAVSEPASLLVYFDIVSAHLTLAHEPVRGESPVLQTVGAPCPHLESAVARKRLWQRG